MIVSFQRISRSWRTHCGVPVVLSGLLLATTAPAQTKLKLSAIQPGTESVQLIANGDFQQQGSLVGSSHPNPTGWNRVGEIFADAGTNMVAANGGVVARANVTTAAPVSQYARSVTLEPATAYVFSAYMWNFGNAANHVTAVIDFNDAPNEPQVTLAYSEADADQGCFVYRSFNTADTGTNINVRVFYDSFTGTGTAANYFPVTAQWDNIAITKAANFVAPLPVNAPPPATLVPLQIQRSGTDVTLAWVLTNNTLVSQFTTNLASPVHWSSVTNPIVAANNTDTVTLAAPGTQNFFRLSRVVDPSTMNRKLLMGYQGWFACPADGSLPNRWVHWFRSNNPVATNATVDFWPDISELDADELFATGLTLPGGAPAKVYSAFTQATVVRHFQWMQDHQLDGVLLQRFVSELSDPAFFALRNKVTTNVQVGAEKCGRVFAIMYDISGQNTNTLVSALTNDWLYLVNTMHVTNSPRYLRHNGKPVVAVWGFGFSGRGDTPAQAQTAINFFKAAGCTVMGGVPTSWRTLDNDAQTNAAWAAVFRSFDIISPWSVGRFGDNTGADNFAQNFIVPDLADATAAGRDYMPVIFPGFSWHNLNAGPFNQTPRNGGAFYWEQAYNAVASGCTMIYGAMFDELDEGTAMFKLAPTAAQLPVQGTFVPLNIDGINLPSDWYLRLANEAGKMLRGEILIRSTMPIAP
jgi:hypothetical protein